MATCISSITPHSMQPHACVISPSSIYFPTTLRGPVLPYILNVLLVLGRVVVYRTFSFSSTETELPGKAETASAGFPQAFCKPTAGLPPAFCRLPARLLPACLPAAHYLTMCTGCSEAGVIGIDSTRFWGILMPTFRWFSASFRTCR